MKILYFIESLRSGGKERRLLELIKGLRKSHQEIEIELVLTKEDIHYVEVLNLGIKIHFIEIKGKKKYLGLLWGFYKIAKEFKPDIIHVWAPHLMVYAIPSAMIFKSKLINNSITYAAKISTYSTIGILSILTFPFSDKIIANSFAGLKTHKLKVSNRNLVIYNGYDNSRNELIGNNLRNELGLNNETILVAMIASFTDAKDYQTFVNATELIQKENSSVVFLCVGEGPQKKAMVEQVKNRKINNFHFLGRRNDVESICSQIDIGVLLSNTNGHAEGISNSIMELMAAGKPVVATNAGGTPELIEDNKSGFLVRAFDEEDVTEKLVSLINEAELRSEMGKNSESIVKNNFSLEKMIIRYYQVYKEVNTNE